MRFILLNFHCTQKNMTFKKVNHYNVQRNGAHVLLCGFRSTNYMQMLYKRSLATRKNSMSLLVIETSEHRVSKCLLNFFFVRAIEFGYLHKNILHRLVKETKSKVPVSNHYCAMCGSIE